MAKRGISIDHSTIHVTIRGDGSKMNFVIPPRRRLGFVDESAGARLPPPNRQQIGMDIISARNLDNTRRRRQTLLHDPLLLGGRPPPSRSGPVRTAIVDTFAHLLAN